MFFFLPIAAVSVPSLCRRLLVALLAVSLGVGPSCRVGWCVEAAETPVAEAPAAGGMYLPGASGTLLWRQTLATVSADWPVVRTIEPDFAATPPRAGLIESAWVEPPAAEPTPGVLPSSKAWAPRRQRVVVRVVPAVSGAWIDAIVETESIAERYAPEGPGQVALVGGWQTDPPVSGQQNVTTLLAARMAPAAEPIYSLPSSAADGLFETESAAPPWANSQHPRLARAGYKVMQDYKNFYSCESLTCLTAAFGAGALMANTGFDSTMQNAWQQGVTPTDLGTFFSDCKPSSTWR